MAGAGPGARAGARIRIRKPARRARRRSPAAFRPRRAGVAAMMYVGALALAVLGVLAFGQSFTESTTLLVARSMAWRHASFAADSALAEALHAVGSRLNRPGDPDAHALRTCPIGAGWSRDVETPVTSAEFGSDVQVPAVKVRVVRLDGYGPATPTWYRFGLLVLSVDVAARIHGTGLFAHRATRWVHEIKQSAAAPPFPFYMREVFIRRFAHVADMEHRFIEQLREEQDHVDAVRDQATGQLRLMGMRMAALQAHIAGAGVPEEFRDHPRWAEISGLANPGGRLFAGLGAAAGEFPLRDIERPEFHPVQCPNFGGGPFERSLPVFFRRCDREPITHEDVVLRLPEPLNLSEMANPLEADPRIPRNEHAMVDMTLLDWPGSQGPIHRGGVDHYPNPTSHGGFGMVIGPYREYRERLEERIARQEETYTRTLREYAQRAHSTREANRSHFEDVAWPSLSPDLTRRRAAFVYDDAAQFFASHGGGSGPVALHGIELITADADLDLTPCGSIRGPGALAASKGLRVGPLARADSGDDSPPVTLIARTDIVASGTIEAALATSDGMIQFRDSARILGTVTVRDLAAGSCGEFRITHDPRLRRLRMEERADGLVVNLSPARTVVYGGRKG
jgi:hypothetical protein